MFVSSLVQAPLLFKVISCSSLIRLRTWRRLKFFFEHQFIYRFECMSEYDYVRGLFRLSSLRWTCANECVFCDYTTPVLSLPTWQQMTQLCFCSKRPSNLSFRPPHSLQTPRESHSWWYTLELATQVRSGSGEVGHLERSDVKQSIEWLSKLSSELRYFRIT